MIFSPHKFIQENKTHRATYSCSLFLLDNILTKSALTTPRMLNSSCTGFGQVNIVRQFDTKNQSLPQAICIESSKIKSIDATSDIENSAKFSPGIPYVAQCNEKLQIDSEFKLDPCPRVKRSLSPFIKKSIKKEPYITNNALSEIETNTKINSNKGLDRFLNPVKKNEEMHNNNKPNKIRNVQILKSSDNALEKINTPISYKGSIQSSKQNIQDNSKNESSKKDTNSKYYMQGMQKYEEGDYKNAIYLLTRAIDTGCQNSKIFYCRSMSYLNIEDYKNAMTDILKSIEISPKDPSLYFHKYFFNSIQNKTQNRTLIQIENKQYTHALGTLKEITNSIDPKNKEIFVYRGICQYKLHNTLPAINDFKKSEPISLPKAQIIYAKALSEIGELEKSKKVLLECESNLSKLGSMKMLKKLAKQWIKFHDTESLSKAEALITYFFTNLVKIVL